MISTGHNELTHAVLENLQRRSIHTREVKHTREEVPKSLIERIEALEEFAQTAAKTVNRVQADYHAARQEIDALNARLNAILKSPRDHGLASNTHDHEIRGVQAA